MAISYELIREQQVVTTVFQGVLREADFAKHRAALDKDENYSSDFNEILDYTWLKKMDVGVHTIQQIATSINSCVSARRAFVTGGCLSSIKLANAIRSIQSRRGAEVEVFENLEEAHSWIKSDP